MQASILMSLAILSSSTPQNIERVNPKLPEVSGSLRKFTQAMGWRKLTDGEWVSSERRIDTELSHELRKDEPLGFGLHEFLFLEWRSVSMSGRRLPVLVVGQTAGAFRYPAIGRHWYTWKEARVYVFESFPFIENQGYEFGKSFMLEAKSISSGGYTEDPVAPATTGGTSEDRIRKAIGKSAIIPADKARPHEFKMVVFPVVHQGKKKVRFLFDVAEDTESDRLFRRTLSENYVVVAPETLNSYYYEAPFEGFRSFFSPLLSKN